MQNCQRKKTFFLIMLRSVVYSISFPEKKKIPNCIMGGKKPNTKPADKQTNKQTNRQTDNHKFLLLKAYQHLQNNCLFSLNQNEVNLKMLIGGWQNLQNRVTTTRCKGSALWILLLFQMFWGDILVFSYLLSPPNCQLSDLPLSLFSLQWDSICHSTEWKHVEMVSRLSRVPGLLTL